MRPKCRGLTNEGKWVKGYYFQIGKDSYIMNNPGFDYHAVQIDPIGPKSPSAMIPSITEEHFVEVLPETIGMFTGLLDKNGKEIYEGDILKHNPDDDDWNDTVIWWPERARFELASLVNFKITYLESHKNDKRETTLYEKENHCLKLTDWVQGSEYGGHNPSLIIGDIHTTPDLLEGKQ